MERQNLAQGILTISDVLTADECQQMIALAEKRGFDAAPIKAFDVEWVDKETRNNDRAIAEDVDLERWIWSRVGEFVPRWPAGRYKVSTDTFDSIDTLRASDSPGIAIVRSGPTAR
jgi:hypothetical protein